MDFIQSDFFLYQFGEKFDGFISDPPYKKCVRGKLNEAMFDVAEFLEKADQLTKKNAFLICFSNFAMTLDLRTKCQNTAWKFKAYQIWDKSHRVRNWISWSMPLRTCEFILYFTKGTFKFDFKNGEIKPPVHRSSFGGKLKNTNRNDRANSYGMFQEIVCFETPADKIHPTQKPAEFSPMYVGIFKLNSYCSYEMSLSWQILEIQK